MVPRAALFNQLFRFATGSPGMTRGTRCGSTLHRVSVASDERRDKTLGKRDAGAAAAGPVPSLHHRHLDLRHRHLDADHGARLGHEHPDRQGDHAWDGQFRCRLADDFSHHVWRLDGRSIRQTPDSDLDPGGADRARDRRWHSHFFRAHPDLAHHRRRGTVRDRIRFRASGSFGSRAGVGHTRRNRRRSRLGSGGLSLCTTGRSIGRGTDRRSLGRRDRIFHQRGFLLRFHHRARLSPAAADWEPGGGGTARQRDQGWFSLCAGR